MEPHRIAVKIYLENPDALDPEAIVPVFHRLIQQKAVEGIPIDVARYAHVPEGPGIILIGHQLDHALDLSEGRPGITITRKRDDSGPLGERITRLVAQASRLAMDLEADPSLGAAIRVNPGEILVTILDRLNAPNDDETLGRAENALREVVAAVSEEGGGEAATITREGGPRDPFTTRIVLERPAPLATWVLRLGAAGVGA